MSYSENGAFPSEASVECDLGDGEVFKDNLDDMEHEIVDGNMKYKISHAYAINGEYNVTCRSESAQ